MKITLNKPFTHEGTEYKELNVDFEGLTTRDYEKAEREFKATNGSAAVTMIESETGFIRIIICKALGQAGDFLDNLSIADFVKLKVQTQTFLLTGTMASLES